MTNAEKVQILLTAIGKIENELGIRRDFVPLGHALAVAEITRDARRAVSDKQPMVTVPNPSFGYGPEH